MEIKDFFTFGSKLVSSTFQASPVGLGHSPDGMPEARNLIKGKYEGINFPVVFKQEYGKKLTDILDTGWHCLFLISDKIKTILEENQITGWKTFSIKLYDKKKNEIFGYHGFSVVGHCGSIDYTKAEIVDRQAIPTGPICKAYKGLYIGLDKWNGSDFFIPDASLCFVINKRTASLLEKNKITKMRLKNLSDVEIDMDAVLNKN